MFRSFFMGGFECSAHRRADGRRLDLLAATQHDRFASSDYRHLSQHGIRTVRDGLRWHMIETSPGHYDWSSFMPMLHAARDNGTEVIWDLCHYGYPDDLDIWTPAFVDRFARFAGEVARLVREETDLPAWYCPVNEISFWAWDGGDMGGMNPSARRRGGELKRQLVRASIAAIDAVRAADARARFAFAEPLINITTGSTRNQHIREAERTRLYQFEALDMLTGLMEPELGGSPTLIDAVGANFYPHNQWYHHGPGIPFGHHHYRPLSDMLQELHGRYDLPVFIAETGAEGSARPSWLHYICAEVLVARRRKVPVEGICLYPVTAYPGWDNERHCDVGLLGLPDEDGFRVAYEPLLAEMQYQSQIMNAPRPDQTLQRETTNAHA